MGAKDTESIHNHNGKQVEIDLNVILEICSNGEERVDGLEGLYTSTFAADGKARADKNGTPEADGSPEEAPGDGDEPRLDEVPADDTIALYLREISRTPLLTQEEEVKLAIAIKQGLSARQFLACEKPSDAGEREVWEEMAFAGELARHHLIRANSRLVVSIAKKYRGQGVSFLDLIQEGNLGLMRAVEKFDHTRGYKFSTYATWWIRQAVQRAVADQGRTIRIPVHMHDRIRKSMKASRRLAQELGREPTTREIAEELEISEKRAQFIMRVARQPLSLDKPVGAEEGEDASFLKDFVADEEETQPTEIGDHALLRQHMECALRVLSTREERVLELRFGLRDGHTYTLQEIGRRFGLTRERIRQIEAEALQKLRYPQRSAQLRAYVLPDAETPE